MSFLHVLLVVDGEKKRCIFKDLSEAELKAQFLQPFRRGEKLLIDGELISLDRARWVKITSTEEPSEAVMRTARQALIQKDEDFNRSQSGVVMMGLHQMEPEDLSTLGEDVTYEYIKGPPMSSPVTKWLNHNWTIAVVGGLLVGIATLLIGKFL